MVVRCTPNRCATSVWLSLLSSMPIARPLSTLESRGILALNPKMMKMCYFNPKFTGYNVNYFFFQFNLCGTCNCTWIYCIDVMLGRLFILPHLNTLYSANGRRTLDKFSMKTIFELKRGFGRFWATQKCSVFTFVQYIYHWPSTHYAGNARA